MSTRLRVLVIDDNPDDRSLIIHELKRQFSNLLVTQIIDMKGLTKALNKGNFNLVITDYELNWTDGIAVLRLVRSRYPQCPVIMFTGSGSQEVAVEAMKSGLNDYVVKSPKHFKRLAVTVQAVMDRVQEHQRRMHIEERYRTLFESVPVGLFRVTLDGLILDANQAMLQLLGYSDKEALLLSRTRDFYEDLDDLRYVEDLLAKEGIVLGYEARLRRKDGQVVWTRQSARAVHDTSGQTIYYEGSIEDITEQKLAAEKEHEAMSRAEFSNNLLTHDLTNVHQALLSLLELMLLESSLSIKVKELVEAAVKQLERGIDLVSKIRQFMRGDIPPEPQTREKS